MKKILLVEDDVFLSKISRKKLEELGHAITLLRDGTGVLEELKKDLPDLIILDLVMPEKDGFQVLEELRSSEFSKVPVMVLSNLSQESDIKRCMDLGAKKYLIKSNLEFSEVAKEIDALLA